jgi:hypothetical protein
VRKIAQATTYYLQPLSSLLQCIVSQEFFMKQNNQEKNEIEGEKNIPVK